MFKRLYEAVFGNFRLKLIALGISVIVWLFASSRLGEQIELSVPLNLEVPPGYQLLAQTRDRIRVRISGPQSLIAGITKELAMSRKLSEQELKDGRVTVDVSEDWLNIPESVMVQLKVTVLYPLQVTAYASPVSERTLPVRVLLQGKPRQGFEIVDRRIMPSQVRVQGPGCVIEELEYVEADEFWVSDIESDLEAEIALVAQRSYELADGVRVTVPLKLSPGKVTLRVMVSPQEKERRFPEVPVVFLMPPDFPYEVGIGKEEANVTVVVRGLPQNVERLKADSLVAYVDLRGLEREDVGSVGSPYRETVEVIWPLDIPLSSVRTEPETVRISLKNPPKTVQ